MDRCHVLAIRLLYKSFPITSMRAIYTSGHNYSMHSNRLFRLINKLNFLLNLVSLQLNFFLNLTNS